MKLDKVMQALYNSEINCEVSSNWDAGFTVRLGCTYSRKFIFEVFDVPLNAVAATLHNAAVKHYPNSNYSATYKNLRVVANDAGCA